MATPLLHLLIFSLLLSTALSATCSAPKLTSATNFTTCIQLPTLSSALRYTYTPANKTLSLAFTATPPSSSGWVAVGINPNATGMAGTQAFVAYKNTSHGGGGVTVSTFNLSSHSDVIPGELSFPVYSKRAEFNADYGSITVYATVKSDGGKVNFVWQVGHGVTSSGFPEKHDFEKGNLRSKVTLNVSSASGGILLKKTKVMIQTHGILCAISCGLLFPIAAIISRYQDAFERTPAWFCLFLISQTSAYAIGLAGYITGVLLWVKSTNAVFDGHLWFSYLLICLYNFKVNGLLLRPADRDHQYRVYWDICNHIMGYIIIILAIIEVFKGFGILEVEKKWRIAYIILVSVLGGVAVAVDVAVAWIVFLRRKSSSSPKT